MSDYPFLPPGVLPLARPSRWATFLDDSTFASVQDPDITSAVQPDSCPIILIGTSGSGLGRYHVADRRWLDRVGPPDAETNVTINARNGFLLPKQDHVTDVSAFATSEGWIAWVGTRDGLAGGLVWPADSSAYQPEASIRARDWTRLEGERLLGPGHRSGQGPSSRPRRIWTGFDRGLPHKAGWTRHSHPPTLGR